MLVFVLVGQQAVYGTTIETRTDNNINFSGISIPSEVYNYVDEKDLVEYLCYETKWKGAEALARIGALNSVLVPAFKKLEENEIAFNDIDLESINSDINSRIDGICSAVSVGDASTKINDYINFSRQIQGSLERNLGGELRSIENDFRRRGEELRERLNREMDEEAKRLAEEAENRLRQQGEEEGRLLEGKLRELSNEFKEMVIPRGEEIAPGEVISVARRLSSGFSNKDPEVNSFLSSRFQEILIEATSLADLASSGGLSPAQAQSRAQQRVPGVVSEIRDFMQERYRNLGKQEEQAIREMLQEKAETIAGEEKEKLESIQSIFENIEEEVERNYQSRMENLKQFEQRALQKRKEIIVKIIDANFEEALKLIESKKTQIDDAVESGVAQEFGITSYEQLISDINSDRDEIANELLSSQSITSATIVGIQEKFQNKWNNYRLKMESIEFSVPEKVIEGILSRHDIKFFEDNLKRVENNLSRIERDINRYDVVYNERIKECNDNPRYTISPTSREIGKCISCLSLNYIMDEHRTENTENYEKLKDGYQSMSSLIQQLKAYSVNPPNNMQEAIQFKNELQESYRKMNEIAEKRDALGRETNRVLAEKKQICENLIK